MLRCKYACVYVCLSKEKRRVEWENLEHARYYICRSGLAMQSSIVQEEETYIVKRPFLSLITSLVPTSSRIRP